MRILFVTLVVIGLAVADNFSFQLKDAVGQPVNCTDSRIVVQEGQEFVIDGKSFCFQLMHSDELDWEVKVHYDGYSKRLSGNLSRSENTFQVVLSLHSTVVVRIERLVLFSFIPISNLSFLAFFLFTDFVAPPSFLSTTMGKSGPFSVEPGMRGILISCFRKREPACVLEAYNLFDDYLDTPDRSDLQLQPTSNSTRLSVEDEIESELKRLRNKKEKSKPFLNVPLGDLECLVFIKTPTQVCPSEIVRRVLDDMLAGGPKRTRYCHRLIPLDSICYTNMNDLQKTFEPFIDKYFSSSQPAKTYCLLIESRFNSSLNKDEIIRQLPPMIPSIHRVQFERPDLTVVIQIFKNVCGISVLNDYSKYKKYNIQQCALGRKEPITNSIN